MPYLPVQKAKLILRISLNCGLLNRSYKLDKKPIFVPLKGSLFIKIGVQKTQS
jgi:hypothetical protein